MAKKRPLVTQAKSTRGSTRRAAARSKEPKKVATRELNAQGGDAPTDNLARQRIQVAVEGGRALSQIEISQGLFGVHRLAELGANDMDEYSLKEFAGWLASASSLPLSLERARLAWAVLEFLDKPRRPAR
ncbi:MAG TPA: hypothetical protein VK841_13835 [Polyangiaceae bacterium]|nr:hypothetical protein [Polyangiaceae bacterium]